MATNTASAPSSTNQPSMSTTHNPAPTASTGQASTSTSTSAAPPPSTSPLPDLLSSNTRWATSMQESQPALMAALATGQQPHTLWIGCSDSRVAPELLTSSLPGTLFVHRNVANVVHAADSSLGAALAYAVGPLGVRAIVLCGHTGCGGVAAALGGKSAGGVIDAWLAPVREVRARFETVLKGLAPQERAVRLVEENVRVGVQSLRSVACVIAAEQERGLVVHGLVYDVGTGRLRELDVKEPEEAKRARADLFRLE